MDCMTAQRRLDEANAQRCVLRRPLYFPTRLQDVHDRNDPSMERYQERDGVPTPKVHWTVLCDVIDYLPSNMAGRPMVRCRDSAGEEFNVIGYFEGRRNDTFDRDVEPQLKPSRVLAFRYGEKKTFLDQKTEFRIEDHHVPMLKVIPGPLTKLLAAADVMFSEAADTLGCWSCKGMSETFRRCTQCKLVRYCNKECEKGDWDSHKHVCKYVVHVNELIGQGSAPFTLESFDDWVSFPRDDASAVATPSQDNPVECDVCGKRFDTEDARDQHREAKHVHFGSDDCGREFISAETSREVLGYRDINIPEHARGHVIGKGRRNIKEYQLRDGITDVVLEEGRLTVTGSRHAVDAVCDDVNSLCDYSLNCSSRQHHSYKTVNGRVILPSDTHKELPQSRGKPHPKNKKAWHDCDQRKLLVSADKKENENEAGSSKATTSKTRKSGTRQMCNKLLQ